MQKIFHIVAFIQTFCVWFWHFTPAASYLPGASLYGFFFRYLTFCTYTLQTVYLGCAIVSDFTNKVRAVLLCFKSDRKCFPLSFTFFLLTN